MSSSRRNKRGKNSRPPNGRARRTPKFYGMEVLSRGIGGSMGPSPHPVQGAGATPLVYAEISASHRSRGHCCSLPGYFALFRDQGTPCPCPIPCMRTARNLPTKDASVGTSSPTTAEVLEALALDSTTSPMLQVLPPIDVIHVYFRPCSPVPTAVPSDRSGYTGGKVAACSSLFHSDRIWVRL